MAAPLGNQYAAKDRLWRAAILRALEARSRVDQVQALDKIAEAMLSKAAEGDLTAIKELGDRLDGKSMQYMEAKVSGNLAGVLGSIGPDTKQSSGDDPPLA